MHEHALFELLEDRILFSGTLETGFGDFGVDPGRLVASSLVTAENTQTENGPLLGGVDLLDITADYSL